MAFVLAPGAARWTMSAAQNGSQRRQRIRSPAAAAVAALLSVQLVGVPPVNALATAQLINGMLITRARPTLVIRNRSDIGDPVLDSFAPIIPDVDSIIELERATDPAIDSIAPTRPNDGVYGKGKRNVNPSIGAIAPILADPDAALKKERAGSPQVDSIAPFLSDVDDLIEREIAEDAIFRTMIAQSQASPPEAAGDSSAPPGVVDGVLRSCIPTSLACVSSQDDTPASFTEPWEYDTTENAASVRTRVVSAIVDEGGVINVEEPPYIRALFGKDELELYFTAGDATVQLRADGVDHPRVDFGRNRRRVERIRRAAGLEKVVVLRARSNAIPLLDSPFDSFAPSLPDADAIIDRQRTGDTFLAKPTTN